MREPASLLRLEWLDASDEDQLLVIGQLADLTRLQQRTPVLRYAGRCFEPAGEAAWPRRALLVLDSHPYHRRDHTQRLGIARRKRHHDAAVVDDGLVAAVGVDDVLEALNDQQRGDAVSTHHPH